MTYRPPETITSQILRHGLLGVASSGVASTYVNGLDEVLHQEPADVTGLAGAQVDTGSVLHHGPSSGGELLDRPVAGYMAESSAHSGLSVEQSTSEVSRIARDLNEAGTFTHDGQSYEVLDYIPGGDFVQIAAGTANPTQIMMTIAQHGIINQMRQQDLGSGGQATEAGGIGDPATAPHRGGAIDGARDEGRGRSVAGGQGSASNDGGRSIADAGHDDHDLPDADENARDREALMLRHRLDLDTAIETSDQSRVTTEIHAHGRTLTIDTEFEARAQDNSEERAEAEDHVHEASRAATEETENSAPDMHFRSKVQAHLDAASRDDGMAI